MSGIGRQRHRQTFIQNDIDLPAAVFATFGPDNPMVINGQEYRSVYLSH
jgi:hypothetical protein